MDLVLSDEHVDLVENAKLAETTRSVIASTEYIAKYGEPTTPQELSNHRLPKE